MRKGTCATVTDGPTVLPATTDDLDDICRVARKAFGDDALPPISIRQYLDLFPDLVFVAKNTANRVVGYCVAGLSNHNPPEAWILSVAVDPAARRQRTGATLLAWCTFALAAHDHSSIYATVHPDNTPSQHLLKMLGFEPVRTIDDYYGTSGGQRLLYRRPGGQTRA